MPPPGDDDPLANLPLPEDDPLAELEVPAADYDAARPADARQGLEAIPERYEESGDRRIVLPEVSMQVDPTGELPDIVSTRGETTHYRGIRPDAAARAAEQRRLAGERPVEPDAGMWDRLVAWGTGRDPEALGTARLGDPYGGYEVSLPSISRAGRVGRTRPLDPRAQLGALFATAPRPEHMTESEPDLRSQAVGRSALSAFGWADELGEARDALGLSDVDAPSPAERIRIMRGAATLDPEIAGRMRPEDTQDPVRRVRGTGSGAQMRAMRALSEQQAPLEAGIGSAVEAVPLMALPGGQATLGGRMAAAGGQGFLAGMLRGGGESLHRLAEEPMRLARDVYGQGAVEGLLAAGGGGLVEGVAAPALRRLGAWASRRGDTAARAAVPARLEATGIGSQRALRAADELRGGREAMAADVRRLGIGHGISHAGQPGRGIARVERARADAEEVREQAGRRMGDVVAQMDRAVPESAVDASARARGSYVPRGMVDVRRVSSVLEDLAAELDGLPVGGPRAATALREQIIEPLRVRGAMTFRQAHAQRRMLDDIVSGREADPDLARIGGRAQAAADRLRGAMDRAAEVLDPRLRLAWRQANRDWSVSAHVRKHGAEVVGSGGGMAGNVAAGVANAAASVPGGGLVSGAIAREVTQQERSLRPGLRALALESLAPRLRSMGPRGERWARLLEGAQQRGRASLATAHYALSRTDPEYRAALTQIQEGEEE